MRWLTVLTLLVPLEAAALSCMPWGVENAYREAAESPDPYMIALGQMAFDAGRLPVTDWERQAETPPRTEIPMRFVGHAMTSGGVFDAPIARDGILAIDCAGPWCASGMPGKPVLVFINVKSDGALIESRPCGGMIFDAPTEDMLKRLRQCHAGGPCEIEMR